MNKDIKINAFGITGILLIAGGLSVAVGTGWAAAVTGAILLTLSIAGALR